MGRIVLAAAVIIGALFLGMFIIKGNSKTSQATGGGGATGGEDESAEARLKELQELRDKDLISETEYQRKRADVLKDL
jgi:hypothetical protein